MGCTKTHLINEAPDFVQTEAYLMLSYTTAGVTALKKRLSRFAIPPQDSAVTTIDGWTLKLLRKLTKYINFKVLGCQASARTPKKQFLSASGVPDFPVGEDAIWPRF